MKRSTKKTLTTVGVVILAVVVITMLPSFFNFESDDSDFDKVNLTWDVGALDESGAYTKDDCALYTKDLIECTGVELCAEFDSNISYEVHFYKEDGTWISMTANEGLQLTVDEMPDEAFGIRIVIRPLDDDNDKISLFEKYTYASQLTVKIRTEEVEADTAA